ncbi:MAG: antibiotic biosynthesis monooxygenase [Candidatus Dormibacteraeota bacterium]|nr:antibiotic biosynthesis monooxygenase [Candidatus Dormibacteraeota bacterium]
MADRVAETLVRHAAETRREPGCLRFDVYRSSDADSFVLLEEYIDEGAFRSHRGTPHFKANIEQQVAPLLSEREWERYFHL